MTKHELLRYGSEPIRDYFDTATGDVRPLANMLPGDSDESFAAYGRTRRPTEDAVAGFVTDGRPQSTPADHKAASLDAALSQQFSDGAAIENKEGVPDYFLRTPDDVDLSAEQLAVNAVGMEQMHAMQNKINEDRIAKLRREVIRLGQNPDAVEVAFRSRLEK